MDIFNNKTRKVVCVDKDERGSFSFGENPSLLTVGEQYAVVDIDIHSWHTMVTLLEFPNEQFNSVHFEEIEET